MTAKYMDSQMLHSVHTAVVRSKVAPSKVLSLPRLELCAASILCDTWNKIKHKFSNIQKVFWTDSKIVLHWLTMHSSQLNCFVANRISGIQTQSSNISWRHVPGKENPTDIISRGCKVSELQNTSWFTGPTFLKLEEHLWPQSLDKIETIDADLEIRKISSFKCTEPKENILDQILNRISLYRVLRVTAYVLRAFNEIPASKNLCVSQAVEMPATELHHSFLFIVGLIQHQTYWKEIDCLQKAFHRAEKFAKSDILRQRNQLRWNPHSIRGI
nr:uncharacterized protein LOC118879391 isoform X1 [Drosophila suzukii]